MINRAVDFSVTTKKKNWLKVLKQKKCDWVGGIWMNEWLLFQYGSFDKLKTSLRESHNVCKGLFRVTIKVQKLCLQN